MTYTGTMISDLEGMVQRVERSPGQCERIFLSPNEEHEYPCYREATVGSIELQQSFCSQCAYECCD